jgi:hypothetical protein
MKIRPLGAELFDADGQADMTKLVVGYYYYYYYYHSVFLTAVGLTPGGSSTVHIYTQTVHRIQRTEHT